MALFYNFLKPMMWVSSVSFLFLFGGMAILQKAHSLKLRLFGVMQLI